MTVSSSTVSDKAANISVQTDEFLVSPYEHLFPFILPQWNSNNDKVPVSKESNNLGGRALDHSENPYDILDHYVQAAYKTTKTGSATNKSSPDQEIKQLKVLKPVQNCCHTYLYIFKQKHVYFILALIFFTLILG